MGDYPLHGAGVSGSIQVRTGRVYTFEGSRYLRDGNGNLPDGAWHTHSPIPPVQVLTGTQPFGKLSMSEVVFKVLGGENPPKPTNAPELGLSDSIWKFLEDCWQTERTRRPLVKEVSGYVTAAASVCGMLSSVGGIPQQCEDPETDFTNFGRLPPQSSINVKLTGH